MTDVARLYSEVRGRITDLVRDLDEAGAARTVPPCPEWSVKDVVAHLTGVCADILAGRLEGVATDAWTQRQVVERRDRSVAEIVEEWSEAGPRCEEMAGDFPPDPATQWVADATTHEHDVRCALGRAGERDSEAVAVSFAWMARVLGSDVPFRIRTPQGDDVVVGDGDPQATVEADRFEMFRALTGRRSEEQIAAFAWSDDHRSYLSAFSRGPFRMAAAPVHE